MQLDGATQQPGYLMPPASVADLADATPIPSVVLQPRTREHLVHVTSSSMLELEDVVAPVLKLGGSRFNPCTLIPHGGSGVNGYHSGLEVQTIRSGDRRAVSGLPANARIEHLSWSPDGSKMAFSVRTSEYGNDAVAHLWMLDVAAATAAPVQPLQRLNSVLGSPFHWLPSSQALIVKRPIGTRADAPAPVVIPTSPSVQQSAGDGTKAAMRTYPDLLTSAADEAAFRHYTTVQLVHVTLGELAVERLIGPPGMYYGVTSSPDGAHLLTASIRDEHLSYSVPWSRFGRRVEIMDLADGGAGDGETAGTTSVLQETEVLEAMPIGQDAARPGARDFEWRPDVPATIFYAEALDGGDPKVEAEFRDKVLLLPAPFNGPPSELLRTKSRYLYLAWSARGEALAWSRWYQTRATTILKVDSAGQETTYMAYDFSDAYGHPGSPLMEEGPWGRGVMRMHGDQGLLWSGGGASEDGARPFLDVRSFADGSKERRLWRGAVGCYDALVDVLPSEAAEELAPEAVAEGAELLLMSIRQTQTEPPQVLLRAVSAASAAAASADVSAEESRVDSSSVVATLSAPEHPQPALEGINKLLLKYNRSDDVPLSGTLYTPAGYDASVDGPLPTILWACTHRGAQTLDSPSLSFPLISLTMDLPSPLTSPPFEPLRACEDPQEYKSKAAAGQVRGSEHTFTMVGWSSPLFWLTRGYAVLDGCAMPIVGEGEVPENDNYVEQLVLNVEAAVGALRARGVSDHRLAVGGHSCVPAALNPWARSRSLRPARLLLTLRWPARRAPPQTEPS